MPRGVRSITGKGRSTRGSARGRRRNKKPTSLRFKRNYNIKEGASDDPVTNRSAKIARQVGTRGEKVTTGGRQIGPGGVSAKEQPGFVAPVSEGGRKRAKRVVELEAKKRNNTATKKELEELKRLDEQSAQAEDKRRKNISRGLAERGTKARKGNLAAITFGKQPETTSNKRSGNIDPETGEVTGTPTKKQEEAARRNLTARNRQKTMTSKQLVKKASQEELGDRAKKGKSKVGRRGNRVVGQKGATKTAAKTAQVKRKGGGQTLKTVDAQKNPGLAKLSTGVRNKMGYAKTGGQVIKRKKSGRISSTMSGKDLVASCYD